MVPLVTLSDVTDIMAMEDQTTMTVSVPRDSNKRKVEPPDDTPQPPSKKINVIFEGKV